MKSTTTLKAAGLVLIAVVLGMLTVQGSYALWNKSVSSNAGTVQAADFRISLTDTDAIDRALARIADGTYGTCESCGNPIGKGRAMAFPRATLCLTCKQREERR